MRIHSSTTRDLFDLLNADAPAVDLYRKVWGFPSVYFDLTDQDQAHLSSTGIVDSGLEALVNTYGPKVDRQINEILARAPEGNTLPVWGFVGAVSRRMSGSCYQKWRPTNSRRFPTNQRKIPLGPQKVEDEWKELASEGSMFFHAYLTKLAIETNHVESIFLLTDEVCLFPVSNLLALSHCIFYFLVNSRPGPAWLVRRHTESSSTKLLTRRCQD